MPPSPASTAAPPGRPVSLLRVALITVPLAHLVSAAFHILCGGMNADEGFYAIAARSALAGDMPYRDFGYTQMPLLPYVNGLFLSVAGWGLFAQRTLNALWALLALLVAAHGVARRSHGLLALGVAAAFSLSPWWMYFTHLGKTYAFTSLVAAIAAGVFVGQRGGPAKLWLLGLLGVVGTGCRLPSAPYFAVLWLAAWWHDGPPDGRRAAHALGGIVVPGLALLGPFYIAAPENARFWVFDFHAFSVPLRHWRASLAETLGIAPVWWTALGLASLLALRRRHRPRSREAGVVLAALVALAANLVPSGSYAEYAVPFVLPLAAAVAVLLHRATAIWTARRKQALVGFLAAAHLGAVPALGLATGRVSALDSHDAWFPAGVPLYDFELHARLARARRIVELLVPPGAPLLGPNLILAAETGRSVPRAARMGPFAMTAEFSVAEATKRHLLTYADLHAWLADPKVTLLAFFTTPRANYAWSVPSFRLQPREEAEAWLGVLRRDFVIVQQEAHFLLVARPGALPAKP